MIIKHPELHHIYNMIEYPCFKPIIKIEHAECSICTLKFKNIITLECGHKFCKFCIIEWVNTKLDDGRLVVYCMNTDCKKMIIPTNVESSPLAQRLDKSMLQNNLLSMKDKLTCRTCEKVMGFGKKYFLNCIPCYLNCDDCKQYKETKKENEILSNNYKEICKKCPKCRIIIDKDAGCSHMTCRCGFEFCWHCKSEIGDQNHACLVLD